MKGKERKGKARIMPLTQLIANSTYRFYQLCLIIVVIFEFKNLSKVGLDIPKGRLDEAELDVQREINTLSPFDSIKEMLMTDLIVRGGEKGAAWGVGCLWDCHEILLYTLNHLMLMIGAGVQRV